MIDDNIIAQKAGFGKRGNTLFCGKSSAAAPKNLSTTNYEEDKKCNHEA
jgi:hypothetical protein